MRGPDDDYDDHVYLVDHLHFFVDVLNEHELHDILLDHFNLDVVHHEFDHFNDHIDHHQLDNHDQYIDVRNHHRAAAMSAFQGQLELYVR